MICHSPSSQPKSKTFPAFCDAQQNHCAATNKSPLNWNMGINWRHCIYTQTTNNCKLESSRIKREKIEMECGKHAEIKWLWRGWCAVRLCMLSVRSTWVFTVHTQQMLAKMLRIYSNRIHKNMPLDFYVNSRVQCAYTRYLSKTKNSAVSVCLCSVRFFVTSSKVREAHSLYRTMHTGWKKNWSSFLSNKRTIFAHKSTKNQNRCSAMDNSVSILSHIYCFFFLLSLDFQSTFHSKKYIT